MYETAWWTGLVKVWEVIVYNPVMDLQQGWQVRVGSHHSMQQCFPPSSCMKAAQGVCGLPGCLLVCY
jgi:hypothetical protein